MRKKFTPGEEIHFARLINALYAKLYPFSLTATKFKENQANRIVVRYKEKMQYVIENIDSQALQNALLAFLKSLSNKRCNAFLKLMLLNHFFNSFFLEETVELFANKLRHAKIEDGLLETRNNFIDTCLS